MPNLNERGMGRGKRGEGQGKREEGREKKAERKREKEKATSEDRDEALGFMVMGFNFRSRVW